MTTENIPPNVGQMVNLNTLEGQKMVSQSAQTNLNEPPLQPQAIPHRPE